MAEFALTSLKDFDLSQDGRNAILNFVVPANEPLALKISTLDLQRLMQEIGALLTKARQLSDVSKQNVVPFFRPSRYRADLVTEGSTVVIAFAHDNGLEQYYGLEPTDADKLAHQILDAAERGKKAKPPARN